MPLPPFRCEALRLADKRFTAGVVSFLEVLDAQRQLLAAETDLVGARQTRQVALVQVYRALGGGWLRGEPVPVHEAVARRDEQLLDVRRCVARATASPGCTWSARSA